MNLFYALFSSPFNTNDFENCLENSTNLFFAYDTLVFIRGNKTTDISFKTNTELLHIENWLTANKLSLKIDKIYFLLKFKM